MISGNDYLKFMIDKWVQYLHMSHDERKIYREKKSNEQLVYSTRWLGVLPFMIKTWIKKLR